MKRVRYLVGAAALAPAVAGMAFPTAATAATGGSTGAKTVSVHQTRATVMAPDAGCTASAEFQLNTVGHKRGHGWVKYTDNHNKFCIGTVDVSLEFTKTLCKNAELDTSGSQNSGSQHTHQICGYPAANGDGKWFETTFSIHKSFLEPGYVCVSSTYGSNKCEPFKDF
jgi:hypothetical protein